jgi:hypothetical protein
MENTVLIDVEDIELGSLDGMFKASGISIQLTEDKRHIIVNERAEKAANLMVNYLWRHYRNIKSN